MKKRKGIYRNMRFLWAMTLAGGMLLSACTEPALAGESSLNSGEADPALVDTDRKCSLTVYKYDMTSASEAGVSISGENAYGEADQDICELFGDYAVEGVEFSYLYCGDVRTYTGGSEDAKEIELVYAVPEELCVILGLEKEDAFRIDGADDVTYYSSDQITEAWKEFLVNGSTDESNKLAKNRLEDYLNQNENARKMPLTDSDGMTMVSDLSQGLYLVVETKVPEDVTETVNPWFVTLPFTSDSGEEWMYDLTCYPKNQTGMPTLEKFVRDAIEAADGRQTAFEETATASEGETLDYLLVSKLPHIQSKATWLTEYTFSDCLSEGLTYGKDAKIAFYTSREAALANDLTQAVEIWDESSDTEKKYTQEYGNSDSDAAFAGTTMTITMTETGLQQLNTERSDYWMTVFYTATMHSDRSVVLGDEGNPNKVTLLWRRTSDSWYDTLEDECRVFTYGIDLEKRFSDGKGNPEKAEFLLEYVVDGTYLTAELEAQKDGEKIYYISGRTDKKEEATRFSVNEGGTCQICGLRADQYRLTEEKTDTDYQLLSRAIEFSFIQTELHGSVCDGATAVVDSQEASLNENGRLALQVINYRRVLIPQTGDRSLFIIYVLAAAIIVFGCTVFRKKKGRIR